MTFNLNEYSLIKFKQKPSNLARTVTGRKVGSWLAVSYGDRPDRYIIYNIYSGNPVLMGEFLLIEDAIYTATFIHNKYAKYFALWKEFPELTMYGDVVDGFSIVKWTIPDGLRLYETLQILRSHSELSASTVNQAFRDAENKVGNWYARRIT